MVEFVGAGPGAPDLITLRGAKLISEADVIIYAGSLVNPQVLATAKEGCEIHNSAYMTLDEVIACIQAGVEAGKKVVRLHTGDPSLYGAVKEQMDRLAALGIPFRVCPGVSSFSGAAAALNLEYTLPGVSQSVIITRAEGRTKVPQGEALASLASHQATMVLFLSAGMAEKVKEELLAGGYPPSTPCAVVYKATWDDEKIFRGTLAELPALLAGYEKTALIVVGAVLESDYQLSKLYDASFTTGFRKGRE